MFSRIQSRLRWELHKRRLHARARATNARRKHGEPGAILFFQPDAAITPHYAATLVIAKALQERGHSVLIARCFELFARCPVLDNFVESHVVSPKVREQHCVKCLQSSVDGLEQYGLEALDLRRFHTPALRSKVVAAMGTLGENYATFEYEGYLFGQLAIMNLALATKIMSVKALPPEVKQRWRDYIETGLTSFLLTRAILEEVPIHSVVHYNDYAIYLGVRLASAEKHVPDYTITHPGHRGIDRTQVMIAPQVWAYSYYSRLPPWPQWRKIPLDPPRVRQIGEDLKLRFLSTGSHVYSPAKTMHAEVRARFGVPESATLLVAYTSSLDEVYSARATLEALQLNVETGDIAFPDQMTWLDMLSTWIQDHPDVHLIVRVHPREGVNKRDKVVSEHLALLKKRFAALPPRVHFVWPENKISSYDLAETADVILTSWSSVGLELARLGVPAMSSMGGWSIYPPDDFLHYEANPKAYFQRLESLLDREADLDRIARAFRCYFVFHLGSTVNLDDVIPSYDYVDIPPYKTPREANLLEAMLVGGEDVFRKRFNELSHLPPRAETREREALVETLESLVQFIATGAEGRDIRFSVDGRWIEYTAGGETVRRFSPLCARLLRALHAARQGVADTDLSSSRRIALP